MSLFFRKMKATIQKFIMLFNQQERHWIQFGRCQSKAANTCYCEECQCYVIIFDASQHKTDFNESSLVAFQYGGTTFSQDLFVCSVHDAIRILERELLQWSLKKEHFQKHAAFLHNIGNIFLSLIQTQKKKDDFIFKKGLHLHLDVENKLLKTSRNSRNNVKTKRCLQGPLQSDAILIFSSAYGLNGNNKKDHKAVIAYCMEKYKCSQNAVCALLYGYNFFFLFFYFMWVFFETVFFC